MQRELKFRVWNKFMKAWMAEDVIAITGNNELIDCLGVNTQLDSQYEDEEIVFQQFTGLSDSKGKEIYEGDIVDIQDSIKLPLYVIKFGFFENSCSEIAGNGFFLEAIGGGEYSQETLYEEIKLKIAGNIFENPELCVK